MAELQGSRRQHYTVSGQTATRVFTGTWAELNNPLGNNLPIIGSAWSTTMLNLCVTDIDVVPLENNNTHGRMTVTYSTRGYHWPEQIPNTVASTKLAFDFQTVPGTSDSYWDYTLNAQRSWTERWDTSWKAAHSAVAPVATPPRVRESSTIVMTITGNVTDWQWEDVSDLIGTVNHQPWLVVYADRYVTHPSFALNIPIEAIYRRDGFDDTGKWLLTGFSAENIGRAPSGRSLYPNYAIAMTFIYEEHGWNTIYDVTGYQAYQTGNFTYLPRPAAHNVSLNSGLRT